LSLSRLPIGVLNGALSNLTPRGEIVCEFHFEHRDLPTEQTATVDTESGAAIFSDFQENNMFARDVKFGIVMSVPFAKDLILLLNKKIDEWEGINSAKGRGGGQT
jgi:hypothetical protein